MNVEQAIVQTAKTAKMLLQNEERHKDEAVLFVHLFNQASKVQGDAQTFSRRSDCCFVPLAAGAYATKFGLPVTLSLRPCHLLRFGRAISDCLSS